MDKDNPVNGTFNIAPAAGADHLQSSLLQIALRHRWVILAAALLSLVVAFGYLLKATPISSVLVTAYDNYTKVLHVLSDTSQDKR